MKKSIFYTAALAAFALASCSPTGSDDYTEQQTLPKYCNAVFTDGSDEPEYFSDVSYTLVLNYGQTKVDVQIDGLKLPDAKYTSLTFKDLPWTLEGLGWKTVRQTNVTPAASVGAPRFERLNIEVLDRYINWNSNLSYAPLSRVSYEIGDYLVQSLPQLGYVTVGKTLVSSGGQVYEQPDTDPSLYIVYLDADKQLAKLVIRKAKFAENMPALDMSFDKIPFTINRQGMVSMAIDELTPSIIGSNNVETPNPSFPITNLSYTGDACNNMRLVFTCTTHMGGEATPYNVSVTAVTPTSQQQ